MSEIPPTNRRRWRWTVRGIAAAALIALLPGCVNRMFYYPDNRTYRTPAAMGGPVEDIFFPTEDGETLHGWFVPAQSEPVHGTVVHFHGNAQNLTAHSAFVDWMPGAGFNLFLFDYRGYGQSSGRPSRTGLFRDGVAALRHVRTLPGVDPDRIAILGQSLGGTTALAVAGRHPELAGRALVIDSSFYSYRSIVRDKIALIPVLSWFRTPLAWVLISDRYSPAPVLDQISPVPVLFLHGTRDQVIPFHHSERMYAATAEPKRFLPIEGGAHISGMMQQRATVVPVVRDFLIEALDATP